MLTCLRMACIPPQAYALVGPLAACPAIDLRAFIVTERVTLITGASAGISTELARGFASPGHRVGLGGRGGGRVGGVGGGKNKGGGGAPGGVPPRPAAPR